MHDFDYDIYSCAISSNVNPLSIYTCSNIFYVVNFINLYKNPKGEYNYITFIMIQLTNGIIMYNTMFMIDCIGANHDKLLCIKKITIIHNTKVIMYVCVLITRRMKS